MHEGTKGISQEDEGVECRWKERHNTAETATDTNGPTQKSLILGSGARAIKGFT